MDGRHLVLQRNKRRDHPAVRSEERIMELICLFLMLLWRRLAKLCTMCLVTQLSFTVMLLHLLIPLSPRQRHLPIHLAAKKNNGSKKSNTKP